ncbi:uncharacterized protein LAESUDRAFT_728402 [Laetiporus sulphureus 93-53]|uniref:Uncharacterized protein n=1 Tax=Laetiporus sulphureus 93-53 TaxID=1314785 RepID=A0A165D544_9APHY|nr:uncharacterized protein LAESUDRAFT_728402 [Laetiporus sulphureus 93-53]KZT04171.1 hypothetical protein LAESUDRAFT_728402 [Laetiporus sulphureus 93-53]
MKLQSAKWSAIAGATRQLGLSGEFAISHPTAFRVRVQAGRYRGMEDEALRYDRRFTQRQQDGYISAP